jgi:GTP-binding protein Era
MSQEGTSPFWLPHSVEEIDGTDMDEMMMNEGGKDSFRSGFVALVGRPSVGKSTLLNAALGEKVAITSPVAQTTRRRLRGVVNLENAQLVIVDTPGLHKPKDALGMELNRVALGELQDVDAVALLVDSTKPVGRGDAWVGSHVKASPAPYKLLVLTKADIASEEQVSSQLAAARELADFDDELVLSAQEDFNVDAFVELVAQHLPEGPRWFPEDMDIDATDEDLVSEFVREKVLYNMRQEIPHSVGVICDDISWLKGNHASIAATILVERESQKGMVIGRGGRMIKRIGTAARADIARLLGADSVYLDLKVRVQPMWRRDANEIRRLGYQAQE